jgi:hypothetical protein
VVKEKSEACETCPNYKNKDESGSFTNPSGSFKTVDSRDDINYKGHDIVKTSTHCNLGKLRELLSLPITTLNGRFNELAEHVLNQMQGQFWFNVWNSDSGKTVILFVDKEIQLTAKREKEKTKFSKEASDLNKKKESS